MVAVGRGISHSLRFLRLFKSLGADVNAVDNSVSCGDLLQRYV